MTSREAVEQIRKFKPFGYDNDYKEEYVLSGTLNDYLEDELNAIAKDLDLLEILKNKDINLDLLKASIKFGEEQGYYSYSKLWCMDSLTTFNQARYIAQEEYNKIKEWLENDK